MLKRQRQGVEAVVGAAVASNLAAECKKNIPHLNFMNLRGVWACKSVCPSVIHTQRAAEVTFKYSFFK